MAYKYYDLVTSLSTTASGILRDDFQALLNEQFSTATDYYTISEEVTIGAEDWANVEVRITGAIDAVTGEKLSDDFKQILFEEIDHNAELGKKYFFDDNYWVCGYSEGLRTLTANCMVRRANNTLRWVDENGIYYSEPCIMEYKISRPRDEIGSVNPVIPAGYVDVYAQLNDRMKLIKGSQRFIFGPANNRIALKVFGNAVRAYINQQTDDDESGQLLFLSLGGNFVNHNTDDLINGIADRYLDYGNFTSASSVGTLNIISNPTTSGILESASALYTVNYYSGSSVHSGSFVFTVSGSAVPTDNYIFNTVNANSFFVANNTRWLEDSLDILCSGSSGSRILSIELKGSF